MRIATYVGFALFASTCAYGESISPSVTVPGTAGSTSNVLLARLEGVRQFSSGSASPTQRNLDAESANVKDSTIYYSNLDVSASTDLLDTPVSKDKGLGLTEPGDSDVISGGPAGGMQQEWKRPGKPAPAPVVPSPASAALGLIGLAAMVIRRR